MTIPHLFQLVGGVCSTHLKKMRKSSNWTWFPQTFAVNIRKCLKLPANIGWVVPVSPTQEASTKWRFWLLGFLGEINPSCPFGCFLKWWYPPISHPKCWSFLVGKPMVVGYRHFRKPPFMFDHFLAPPNTMKVWKESHEKKPGTRRLSMGHPGCLRGILISWLMILPIYIYSAKQLGVFHGSNDPPFFFRGDFQLPFQWLFCWWNKSSLTYRPIISPLRKST